MKIARSVYKVASTESGQSVTLSDVRNGHLVKVTDEWGSVNLEPGTLVCARVLPGSTMRTFGGIEPLAAEDKKELIQLIESVDTEPGQLVEFLSRGLAGAPFR
ncbi:hypothetical protein GCM10020255_110090 [Rhodococcus baikonurensis]